MICLVNMVNDDASSIRLNVCAVWSPNYAFTWGIKQRNTHTHIDDNWSKRVMMNANKRWIEIVYISDVSLSLSLCVIPGAAAGGYLLCAIRNYRCVIIWWYDMSLHHCMPHRALARHHSHAQTYLSRTARSSAHGNMSVVVFVMVLKLFH